jgi:hypothetical protein
MEEVKKVIKESLEEEYTEDPAGYAGWLTKSGKKMIGYLRANRRLSEHQQQQNLDILTKSIWKMGRHMTPQTIIRS